MAETNTAEGATDQATADVKSGDKPQRRRITRRKAVERRVEGTFDGAPYMGLEPTGSHVELRGIDLIELENGQITSLTAYFDSSSYARQIGLLPADGSGTDRAMKTAFNAATKLRRAVAERRTGG